MKVYSRVGEADLIDSLIWRNKPPALPAAGVLIPFGKRAMMLWVRARRLHCAFPYMRREDAITAALERARSSGTPA